METAARTRNSVTRWGLGLIVLLSALLLYPGWRQIGNLIHPPKPPINDCQQDRLFLTLADGDTINGSFLPLLGPIADMPEFHDCQRFVVPARDRTNGWGYLRSIPGRDNLGYGPLVAIWAANKLDEQFQVAPTVSLPPGGMISSGGPATPGARALPIKATPVAVIYNFERNAGYDPLGIKPGFSCLYLWKDPEWQARLVSLGPNAPVASEPAGCFNQIDTTSQLIVGGRRLMVRPAKLAEGLGPRDIPPVARWDWDGTNNWQYIGIRCGDQWCEIGAPRFAPSEPASGTTLGNAYLAAVEPIPVPGAYQATATDKLHVVAVKGWFDQQRLDARAKGQVLELTDIVGTAFPQPALDSVSDAMFQGNWIPTAYLFVDANYSGKVPLKRGLNRVYLCKGTAADCAGVTNANPICSPYDQDPSDIWWGKIVYESAEPSFRCVRRRTHNGMAIPAAATRWNWSEVDVKTWHDCGGGACCTVN